MRLFIALELPAAAKAVLAAQQEQLRAALGADERAVRWVNSAAMHLTLQFLGETPEAQVPAIVDCVRQRSESASLILKLEGVGVFPNLRRPQVVWSGVGGDVGPLADTQRALSQELEPLGFVPEKRRFSPHLTLGRVRREATSHQLAAIGQAVQDAPPAPACSWECGVPILFQSTLTPQGPIYTKAS